MSRLCSGSGFCAKIGGGGGPVAFVVGVVWGFAVGATGVSLFLSVLESVDTGEGSPGAQGCVGFLLC